MGLDAFELAKAALEAAVQGAYETAIAAGQLLAYSQHLLSYKLLQNKPFQLFMFMH